MTDSNVEIFNAGTVTTHIQWIEIVDLDVLPTVESFACPELGVWLALQDVARLDKSFAEAELVITDAPVEICIIGGVRGVSFYHHLGLHPRLVETVFRVQPVVDKDQFPIGFRFTSEAVFGCRPRRLEPSLLPSRSV